MQSFAWTALADSRVNVVVRIARADGDVHHAILDTGTPQLTIAAPEDESHSFFEYLVLGIDHLSPVGTT